MWLEAIEKRRYQLAKDKPIKLKLTREYLAKVRPPKKRQVTKPQAGEWTFLELWQNAPLLPPTPHPSR
ncbi:unnamed protein product [Toxocara canis]|uniref:Transposase n=1 Tax=Toxocara canis TaxID=6265 RepID=A0A183VBV3_TOXCA|nr:unnamed protein product [Toxocara canis]